MERFVFDETQPTGTMSLANLRENFKALFMMDLLPLRVRAHDTPTMSVVVDACGDASAFFDHVYIGSAPLDFSGGSTPAVSAPSANPRIDIVKIDSAGSLAIITGTEAVTPVATWGSLASDEIPLALLYCQTGMSSIVDYEDQDANPDEGYIYKDVRPFLNLGKANFIDLTDTPSSYTDGRYLKMTGSSIIADLLTLDDLDDTDVASPSNGNILKYSSASGDWQASNEELVNDTSPQLGGDLDLNGNNIDFPTTPNISDCLDEDDMASDSASALATQQSIKAFVESLAKAPTMQVFTSNGTWTRPSGCKTVSVELVGGGGGGGQQGGGGGGGGYTKEIIDVSADAEVTVTVGAGGTATTGNGGTGGTTSFVGYCSATGGAGGTSGSGEIGGAGGVGSDGDINIEGSDGACNAKGSGGNGGNSMLGGGGRGGKDTAGSSGFGQVGNNYGGGGGGGGITADGTGGAGAGGVVIVTEYYAE